MNLILAKNKKIEDVLPVSTAGFGKQTQGQLQVGQVRQPQLSATVRGAAPSPQNDVATLGGGLREIAFGNPWSGTKDIAKVFGSGLQQAAGGLADLSLMGGNVLEDTAAAIRGASQTERNNIYNRYNALRDQIKNAKTINNESYNPREDFQFTGNTGQDVANLTGRSLGTALDATMFVNPTRAAVGSIAKAPLKDTAKFIARDAGFFGTGDALAAGSETFGQTGDIKESAKNAAKAFALSAGTQGALDTAGAAIGKGISKTASLKKASDVISEAAQSTAENALPVATLKTPDLTVKGAQPPKFQVDGVQISPDVQKILEKQGITGVYKKDNPYGAQYNPGDRSIFVRDQSFANDGTIYHELGHDLYYNALTPEERQLFLNVKGDASKQAKRRQGYTAEDIASEDFSQMVRDALEGNMDRVPAQYRSIIAKYADVADQVAPPEVRSQVDAATRLQQSQADEAGRYKVPAINKIKNSLENQLYDPRHIEQRFDNQRFKRLKESGRIFDGQTELLPGESLAQIRGRIQNPNKAAAIRDTKKFTTQIGDFSVDDIIKIYGKEESKLAKDFEAYRLFKDELERRNKGLGDSAPFSTDEMARFIQKYEQANPDAFYHNQALRQKALQDVLEKEQLGIVPQGTYENLSQFEFYTPRTKTTPEDLAKIKVSGGIRSGQKGIQSRDQFNEIPTSPLSLHKQNSIDHERDIANQMYGLELRKRMQEGDAPGVAEKVNADTVLAHKQFLRLAEENRGKLTEASKLRDQLKREKRTVTSKARSANKKANKATRKQESLKSQATKRLEQRAKDAEDEVARNIKRLIAQARGKSDNVLNDLVDRDPRYEVELQALKDQNRKLTNLTAKERADQLRYDKAQLDKKYPKPSGSFTRDELLQIARGLEMDAGDASLTRAEQRGIKDATSRRTVTRRLSNKLQNEVDALRGMVEQARTNVADVYDVQKGINKDVRATAQFNPAFRPDVQYRVNGEIGRLELPGEFADNLSKQNESIVDGILDKTARPISNAQKLFWTGPLQPAFKLWNTLVKNPLLMFTNANGVSGVGYNAAKSIVMPVLDNEAWKGFKREMLSRGMSYENALQTRNIVKDTADDVARRANLGTFMKGFSEGTGSWKDLWRGFSNGLAALDNKQRYAVAYGAYQRARRLGMPESQALDVGASASAQVFGDFERVTQLARAMEALVPYTGATQAGTRALYRSARTRPLETAAKVATLGTGMAALAAYSIDNANEYYQDMIDQGQEWRLDNNWVIALPGASKNPETGEWSGIIQIPLLPDIRPMNRAIWRSIYDTTHDTELNPGMLAGELFNQLTGDVATQLYDPSKAEGGNPLTGILPSSPLSTTAKTVLGVNTYTGKPLANEYLATRPRTEQATKYTTDGAKAISKFLGGTLTPQQVDQTLAQMGSAGDVVQNPEDGYNLVQDLSKPIKPGVSLTDKKKQGKSYIEDYEKEIKNVTNEKTFNNIQALHSKGPKGTLNSAQKALTLLNDEGALKFEMKMAEKAKSRGDTVNPLFDKDILTPEQRNKVLTYRQGKIYNSAGQNDAKDGSDAYTALGLDSKWYDDFRAKETAFFKKVNPEGSGAVKTFSGDKRPTPSKELKAKLDQYYKLPSGTGDRSRFLRANPEITDYWAKREGFTNRERIALGFKPVEDSGNYSSGGGSGSSSYASSRGGSRGGRSSKQYVESKRKYRIDDSARSIAKATVTAKKAKKKTPKSYKPRANVVKPTVTIKKSLV